MTHLQALNLRKGQYVRYKGDLTPKSYKLSEVWISEDQKYVRVLVPKLSGNAWIGTDDLEVV